MSDWWLGHWVFWVVVFGLIFGYALIGSVAR
jgi:hypothetical protein